MTTYYDLHRLSLIPGQNKTNVVAKSEGYQDSKKSVPLYFNAYYITAEGTNCSITGYPLIIDGELFSLTIYPGQGYSLPDEITVNGITGTSGSNGVEWEYIKSQSQITLENATGPISVKVVCK